MKRSVSFPKMYQLDSNGDVNFSGTRWFVSLK